MASPCYKGSAVNGLFRRGGVWWARLAIPLRLRAAAGRCEFVQSTRTHHFEVAKVVASGMLAAWRQRLFYLESQGVDDRGILKLVDGSPALIDSGFFPLEEAASATGLTRPHNCGVSCSWACLRFTARSGHVRTNDVH